MFVAQRIESSTHLYPNCASIMQLFKCLLLNVLKRQHTCVQSAVSMIGNNTFINEDSNHFMKPLPTLSGRIGKVVASHAEGCKVARSIRGCGWAAPIYTMHEALRGVLPMRVGGPTSQLDLPSLTPLSVAGCGQLQLGVPQWATSVIAASSW